MQLNAREEFWAGEFGDEYTERNRVDWTRRVPFWTMILNMTQPGSVLEVGCNAGWNLRAIRRVDPMVRLRGVDVNMSALAEAERDGLDARYARADEVGRLWPDQYELVFTAGVLIHIAPEDMPKAIESLVSAASKHVLAVEYAAPCEEALLYRGYEDRLWKRPYGEYLRMWGLTPMASGPVPKEHGFDNCHFWLMRK